jgi:hypothetical protein
MSFQIKLIVLCTLIFAGNAFAHHSFVIYDGENYTTYTGILTADRFNAGSHANFDFEVTGPDGEVVTWKAETQAPRLWPEDRPKFLDIADIGQEITVTGWPLRNGAPVVWVHTMSGTESGLSFSVDNRIVRGASQFTFAEGALLPEGADELPEFDPDGRRTRTDDGNLTRFGAALLEELSGKSFDPRQEFE